MPFSGVRLLKLPSVFLGHQYGCGFIRCSHTGEYSRNSHWARGQEGEPSGVSPLASGIAHCLGATE